MLKRYARELTKYEQYFMEAPSDEDRVSMSVAPRANRGTDYSQEPEDSEQSQGASASVAPRANRGTDYSQEPEDSEETSTDETDDGNTPTDYSQDDSGDAPDENNPNNDNTNTNTEDAGGDDGETGDEDEDGDDQPTDYSQEGEGDDNADTNDNSSDNQDEQNQPPDEERIKKYGMYKEFLFLYDTLQTMEDRLRRVSKDDATHNAVINTICGNLSDLKDKIHAFLLVKFKSATYVQIQMFYKMAMAIVKLNLELIKNNSIKLKQ